MSIGIGGACRKVLEDEEIVIYKYSAYNLNEVNLKDTGNIFDGVITIQKSGLVGLKTDEKMNDSTNSKNLIPEFIDFSELFSKKIIIIENCSNCWKKTIEGYDIIGLKLCFRIFGEYQRRGSLPESLGYDVWEYEANDSIIANKNIRYQLQFSDEFYTKNGFKVLADLIVLGK